MFRSRCDLGVVGLAVTLLLACGPVRSVRGEEGRAKPANVDLAQARVARADEFVGEDSLLSTAEGKARAKKARPLRETAHLFVEVDPPDALITVDGRAEGRGKVYYQTASNRFPQVLASADGCETAEGAVELYEREVVKLRLTLRRLGGKLTVLTDPPGADVRVDDAPAGSTPITLRRLEPGSHRVALATGTWSWSGTVQVSRDTTNVISMSTGAAAAPAPQPASRAEPRREARVEPAPAPQPQPSRATEPEPAARAEPQTAAPQPAPAAEARPAEGGRPDCGLVCDRFVRAVQGSDSLREPIKNRCRERCDHGDMKFAVCAWKARSMADVSACASLPEPK